MPLAPLVPYIYPAISHMDPLATAASLFFVIMGPALEVVNTRFVIGSFGIPECLRKYDSEARNVGVRAN